MRIPVTQVQQHEFPRFFLKVHLADTRTKTNEYALVFFSDFFLQLSFLSCSLYVGRIRNYSNASVLDQYRETANKVPLQETINIHGWYFIMKYSIIHPADFPSLYLKAAEKMPLSELVWFYKNNIELFIEGTDYCAPLPSEYKYKLNEECRGLTPCQVFEKYSLEDLELFEQYNLITKEFMNAYNEYHEILRKKEEMDQELKKTYCEKAKKLLTDYMQAIEYAQKLSVTPIPWLNSLHEEIVTLTKTSPEEWAPARFFLSSGNTNYLINEYKHFFYCVSFERNNLKHNLKQNQIEFEKSYEAINQRFLSEGYFLGRYVEND